MTFKEKKIRKKYILIISFLVFLSLYFFLQFVFNPIFLTVILGKENFIIDKNLWYLSVVLGILMCIGALWSAFLYYKKWKITIMQDRYKFFWKDNSVKIVNQGRYFLSSTFICFALSIVFMFFPKNDNTIAFYSLCNILVCLNLFIGTFYYANYLNGWKKRLAKNNRSTYKNN